MLKVPEGPSHRNIENPLFGRASFKASALVRRFRKRIPMPETIHFPRETNALTRRRSRILGALALLAMSATSCKAWLGSEQPLDECTDCPVEPNPHLVDNGDDPPGVEGIGWTTRYPRLSHRQWENSVRDLLRWDAAPGLAASFALDPDSASFDTFVTRTVSANLWNDYQRGAEEVAVETARNGALLDRIRATSGPTEPTAFVREFGRRAFRRPLSDAEISSYVALFGQGATLFEESDTFANGVELVLRAMLQSPHFLYRVESSTAVDGDRVWLSGHEMASRLSYALWNTMPSDELLAAADAGGLSTEAGVTEWTRKMLADPRAEATLVSFHEQFFHVSAFGTIAKNPTLFPTFTLDLEPVLQEESRLFFREVSVLGDGGIADLVTRPVTFVNQATAPFYGVAGTFGADLVRADLDPSQRAGILTHLGFLSRYASQAQSDPILRGVHVSLDFLCTTLEPPPNGVPPLPPIGEGQTNRERVDVSTSVEPCSSCHETFINPLGFAFENYDAIGQWRDTDNGKTVDASATYVLDGEPVSYRNAVELAGKLATSNDLHECYSLKWLEYVLGRRPSVEEAQSLADIAKLSKETPSLRDMIAGITQLDTFRARPKDAP